MSGITFRSFLWFNGPLNLFTHPLSWAAPIIRCPLLSTASATASASISGRSSLAMISAALVTCVFYRSAVFTCLPRFHSPMLERSTMIYAVHGDTPFSHSYIPVTASTSSCIRPDPSLRVSYDVVVKPGVRLCSYCLCIRLTPRLLIGHTGVTCHLSGCLGAGTFDRHFAAAGTFGN